MERTGNCIQPHNRGGHPAAQLSSFRQRSGCGCSEPLAEMRRQSPTEGPALSAFGNTFHIVPDLIRSLRIGQATARREVFKKDRHLKRHVSWAFFATPEGKLSEQVNVAGRAPVARLLFHRVPCTLRKSLGFQN